MLRRPCLTCQRPSSGARCPAHRRAWDRARRPSSHRRGYDAAYRIARAAAIEAEPWCHSRPCPYPDAGTPANPLTADHVRPVSRGGRRGLLVVLCKRCNSAKGDRVAGGAMGGGSGGVRESYEPTRPKPVPTFLAVSTGLELAGAGVGENIRDSADSEPVPSPMHGSESLVPFLEIEATDGR